MKNFQIYLAGGMQNLTQEEQSQWRIDIKELLSDAVRFERVTIIDPVDYFNFQKKKYDSQREVMEYDLYKVKQSDLIIVSFNDPKSLGTMAEIATAYELRKPIIGFKGEKQTLHPWQEEMCNRIFTKLDDLVDYVEEFYLWQ